MHKPTLVVSALLLAAAQASATTTTFDDGIEGWGIFFSNDGPLGDFVEPADGNPGAHFRWSMIDTFGATFRNNDNAAFLGDYSRFGGPLELSVDVKVDSINFFGTEVQRDLVVELFDVDPDPDNPYGGASVFYNLGTISREGTGEWTRLSVVIDDATAAALPTGWGGYGAEDPVTFEPTLPAGRTFSSVLANVDEIRFTTFVPGFFFGFTNFDIRFDNPTLRLVPEPASLGLLAGAWLVAARRTPRRVRRA